MSGANPELLNVEIFYLLFDLLKDSSSHNRFFAIFHLIDKFSKSLASVEGVLIDDIYNLLFDEFAPVADRATWALSIIGDKALDKLIEKYYSGAIDTKIRITYAIGRGNFSERTKDRVKILSTGLQSENQNLRFTAMCEMMSNTPISPWSESEWNSTQDKNIDFEEIYDKILPVAKEFSKLENEEYKNFSNRYINWIEKRKSI
ncbi:HEAT repeat domain-containing protein [Aquimarina rhabdastrellae]